MVIVTEVPIRRSRIMLKLKLRVPLKKNNTFTLLGEET